MKTLDEIRDRMERARQERMAAREAEYLESKVWIRRTSGGRWVQEYLNFDRVPAKSWRLVTVREARSLGVYL